MTEIASELIWNNFVYSADNRKELDNIALCASHEGKKAQTVHEEQFNKSSIERTFNGGIERRSLGIKSAEMKL